MCFSVRKIIHKKISRLDSMQNKETTLDETSNKRQMKKRKKKYH